MQTDFHHDMPMHLNYPRLQEILGSNALDADFELVECTLCRRQYLVDHEHLRVYPHPGDLSVWFLNAEGYDEPCVGCHRADWDFEPVEQAAPEWQSFLRTP
jgi:hypothetical protein